MPERMFHFLARYYSANNAIVIVSGLRGVFICKDTEYVFARRPSFLKLNNVGARRCPSDGSVCVNICRPGF